MIYVVLGPTASNKSLLAEEIANKYNAEVINCDAFQIYIEMNKGTAKPDEEFLSKHKNYHMYNVRHIDEPYDIHQFQKDGRKLLKEFENRNVVLVGGSGLYIKALLFDYKFDDEKKMEETFLDNLTNDELYEELHKIDPIDAEKITRGNRKRLIRALYIYKTHNKSKSELNENKKDELLYENVRFIGLNPPREILYDNINKRVDMMIEDGLIEEVERIKIDYPGTNQALQAIGYKEFYLNLPLEDTIELIKKNTRNYAKRQITFFKHQFQNVEWYESVDEALLNV